MFIFGGLATFLACIMRISRLSGYNLGLAAPASWLALWAVVFQSTKVEVHIYFSFSTCSVFSMCGIIKIHCFINFKLIFVNVG